MMVVTESAMAAMNPGASPSCSFRSGDGTSYPYGIVSTGGGGVLALGRRRYNRPRGGERRCSRRSRMTKSSPPPPRRGGERGSSFTGWQLRRGWRSSWRCGRTGSSRNGVVFPALACWRAAAMAEATVWPVSSHHRWRPSTLWRPGLLGPSKNASASVCSRSNRRSHAPQLLSSYSGRVCSCGVSQDRRHAISCWL